MQTAGCCGRREETIPMSTRLLKPVERPLGLGEQVYHALRAQLRSGSIQPGQALQEVQIAERLGVSRTPVREALARLANEGLLASDTRSFTVPALTRQDIDDIYEVRFLVEPAALRRIAPLTASPARRAPIERALAAADAAHLAGDADAFRDAHVAYRAAWLGLVPNSRLVRVVELYADHMQHIRTLTLDDARVRTIVLRGLTRITAALAAGDGQGAAEAMREHLQQAQRAFAHATGLETRPPARKAARDESREPSRTGASQKARAPSRTAAAAARRVLPPSQETS
jgi:DNA-binding GntR family transcriptional regulator